MYNIIKHVGIALYHTNLPFKDGVGVEQSGGHSQLIGRQTSIKKPIHRESEHIDSKHSL